MKLHLQELKTRVPAPNISYKTDPTVGINPASKSDFLKVDVKT